MKILLTGGSGFLGAAVLARLTGAHEVFALVRNPASHAPGAKKIVQDLTRPLDRAALPESIDAVIHAAQCANYRNFPECGPDVIGVNATATANLLDYAWRAGGKTFCFVSSGTVYEPFQHGLSEDAPLAPTSINGCSKLAGESLVAAYAGQMAASSLRLFVPYGPGQVDRMAPMLAERVRDGKTVTVAGGEGMRFSPIYIDDAAEVTVRAALEGWRGVYNVASAQSCTIREFVVELGQAMGRAPVFADAEGSTPQLTPDLTRLRAKMDLSRFVSLREGIRRMVGHNGTD